MAKQLVSPVERHIEKLLLAVAVLALLGAVARYLIASPNHLQMDGETVTPGTIDGKLLAKAELIRQRIRDAKAEVPPPEPLRDEFERSLAPLKRESWPLVAATGPAAPFVDQPGKPSGQYELLKVMQLPKPKLTFGRSTFVVESTNEPTTYYPANWVTVSSMIDVRQQSKLQRQAYGVTREELIYGPTEIQRRARRPDGSWSDDDWKAVTPWFRFVELPKPPEIKLVPTEGHFEIDAESDRDLTEFKNLLTAPAVQLACLRPLAPNVDNGSPWRFPVISTAVEVLAMDDEMLYPKDPPASDPEDRYGFVRAKATDQATTAAKAIAKNFDEADKLIKQARATLNADDARRAYNLYFQISNNNNSKPADKSRAKRGMADADQAANDIEREKRIRNRGGNEPSSPTQGSQAQRPVRQPLPTQQCWVNDMRPGDVQSGSVYQYRIRFSLLNRLVGEPTKFKEPQDATKVYLTGPWSEPSDPVVIPEDKEFYLATEDERDGQVGVKIFRWYEGVWVGSRKFDLGIGDPVGGHSREKVPSLEAGKPYDNADIDFDTGSVVLDIEFNRLLRERKRGSGRDGVRFADRAKGSCAVAVIGPDGRMIEHLLPVDKDNPSQRVAQSRVWLPSR